MDSLDRKEKHTIGNQIFWLVVRTTVFAVLVVSTTIIILHVFGVRKSKVSEIKAIAEVMVHNCAAAVSFDEANAAKEFLQSLQSRSSITDALIVDVEAQLFASYSKTPDIPVEIPADLTPGSTFSGDQLEIRVPIIEFDQPIGMLVIRSNTSEINQTVMRFIGITAVSIILVLVVGIFLAASLQKSISGPIMELAETAQEISGKGDYSLRVENKFSGEIGDLCQHFNAMLQQIEDANKSLNIAHRKLLHSNEVLEDRVRTRTQELAIANQQLQNEVDDKMRANQELKDVQSQLIETSRHAGMAEIANGVLHNVGNVLNSVNVSATLVGEKISQMKVESLDRAANLLDEHEGDLGSYFTHDERAKHFPSFVRNMVKHLKSTQEETREEIQSLNKNIGFIKDVIQAQQSFAGHCGVVSTVKTDEIFDDALKFVSASFERHAINVEKEYDEIIEVEADKSKLLQILTNFIKNAREAMHGIEDRPKLVRLSIKRSADDMVAFSVTDNGIGISAEQLAKIFTHGFTTKKNGHGFGLHSAAIAAKELNGAVNVDSEGVGLGATFTVEIPSRRPNIPIVQTNVTAGSTISPNPSVT